MLFLVVSFWLGFFALLVYVIGVVGQVYDDAPKWKKKHSRDQKVVFVIAHPDDESMFFAPTLSTLRDRLQQECFILCLSTGNYDGLGETRETELLAAGALCGIPADRIR